jgi:hypothetical protein
VSKASCLAVSSEDSVSFEDSFSDQARRKALEMFEHQPEQVVEEFDFGELFTRILWEKDWTDKLESAVVKIRNLFRIRNTDTKLSKELKALIPDMREVAKAYDEMTTGYKEFIQTILDAKQSPSSQTRKKIESGNNAKLSNHSVRHK